MDTALWIVQVILSTKLISSAFTHGLRQSKPAMQDAIRKRGPSSPRLLRAVAGCMLIGALALILPGTFGAADSVTAAAAAIVALLMLFSILLHVRCREKPLIIADLVLFVLSAFVAYGRWTSVP
ncbi:MAG: DoxX family protein [Anaerolineae bacterium]|jgi:hypothetical protein|nr:DoxX family protein [Anaerolineae bacterium]